MPRQLLPVPFGAGLDRATGALVGDPAAFHDLRNLMPAEGRLRLREGMVATGAPVAADTDIVAIIPFRALRGAVAVTFSRTTLELTVKRLDADGMVVETVGVWGTLISPEAPLPRVVGAESFGKLFLAHEEQLYNFRLDTIYYDPQAALGSQLVTVMADLDGDSSLAPVRFRGVYAHLSFLAGWGYGTESDQNRPEIVRMSEAGDPTVWPKNLYFVVGVRDVPVTNVRTAGGVLQFHKKGETFYLGGTTPANWVVRRLEAVHGCVNGNLAVEDGGILFSWSEQGPRFSTGGLSQDLSIPLELDGPSPAELVAAGDDEYGWAVLDPLRKMILFGFPVLEPGGGDPARTRVYALVARDPNQLRWVYFEMMQRVYCAGMVIEGAQILGPGITAYASAVSAVDSGLSVLFGFGRKADVSWTQNALEGGETVHFFAKVLEPALGVYDGINWAVESDGNPTQMETADPPFLALRRYELALRYFKLGRTAPGYESNSADNWTAATAPAAKTTFETLCSTPVMASPSWVRLDASTTQITYPFTLPELWVGHQLEDSPNGTDTWTVVRTVVYDEGFYVNERAAPTYNPPNSQLGQTRFFRMRAFVGTRFSAYSNVVSRVIGPGPGDDGPTPPGVAPTLYIFQWQTDNHFDLWVSLPVPSAKLEVQTSPDGSTAWSRRYFDVPGGVTPVEILSSIAVGSVTWVRARWAVTSSGVDDFGPWSTAESILLTNEVAPAAATAFTSTDYRDFDDIHTEFAAPGAATGRLMRYKLTAANNSWAFAEVSDPAVFYDFIDAYHLPADEITAYTLNGGASPPAAIDCWSYLIIRTGGRRKISSRDGLSTPLPPVLADEPDTLVAVQFGVAGIYVEWNNNLLLGSRRTWVYWFNTSDGSPGGALGPAVEMTGVGDNNQEGPQLGYVALPLVGGITVRIWAEKLIGGRWLRTTWIQSAIVLAEAPL